MTPVDSVIKDLNKEGLKEEAEIVADIAKVYETAKKHSLLRGMYVGFAEPEYQRALLNHSISVVSIARQGSKTGPKKK